MINRTMKAIVKHESAKGVKLETREVPKPKPHEVLIKVKKTAICGTDLHIYQWDQWAQENVPVPCILGHEFVGTVAELGSHVTGLNIGDRVTAEGHITCGQCQNCRTGQAHICSKTIGFGYHTDGCFAEYCVIPASNIFPIHPSLPDNIAAIHDPLGNAIQTTLSFDLVGKHVLITGAGPMGLFATRIAQKAGARTITITDINPYRLDLAKQLGATRAYNPIKTDSSQVMKDIGIEEGFDVILEMSGHPASLDLAIDKARNGAQFALLGLYGNNPQINLNRAIFKGLTFKGIYGREMFRTWYQMRDLLLSGLDVTPIITHEFNFEDYESAFQLMLEGNCGKIILNLD